MIYKKILEKILCEGKFIERDIPLVSLYNYNLNLNNNDLNEIISEISQERKDKFETEFTLFMQGFEDTETYKFFGINYWNYIGDKFINSYPKYYPKFQNIKSNLKEDSKNQVLYLGNNNPSNQQCCMSTIQFQKHSNKLYITALQRSCDANLGFLSDIYHLKLFKNLLKLPIENISILYGNIHIYQNNINESKRFIFDDGQKQPYKFIQNNKKR